MLSNLSDREINPLWTTFVGISAITTVVWYFYVAAYVLRSKIRFVPGHMTKLLPVQWKV